MNEKEIKKTLSDIKNMIKEKYPNETEKQIEHRMLDMFFKAYCDDAICREDLTALTMALGYEVKNDVLDQVEKEKKEGK